MSARVLKADFQYGDRRHQAETAVSGMWLFLASECLFFGALFLSWIFARHFRPAGFDHAAGLTSLALGTTNSVILLTSGLSYAAGAFNMERGDIRLVIRYVRLAMALGAIFLLLKFGVEWGDDFSHHYFPGANFGIVGDMRAGAALFFSFYFVATALHGVHMLVGLGLLEWIVHRARRGDFSANNRTAVTAVGLYWAFVDLVWIVLYPLIYLVGRGAP